MNYEDKKIFVLNCIYFATWILILFLIVKVAIAYLLPFIIGLIIAYLVQKPAVVLAKKIQINKENCAALLSVIFYLFAIFLLGIIFWLLYKYANKLMLSFVNGSDFISEIKKMIEEKFFKLNSLDNESFKNVFNETANRIIATASEFVSGVITTFVKKIPALIFSAVITIVSTCYISKDFDRLKQFLKGILSEQTYKKTLKIKNSFFECFYKFTVGYFWLFSITFVQLLIGFFVLKIRNVLILSLAIAIVDLLPVFGTGAVLIPWAIFSFLQSNYSFGIGLTILYLVIMVVRNFAEPKIIGKQIDINPIFTLLFIFLGLRIGGIIGMLVFPIALTVAFTYFRQEYYNL